MKKKKKKKKKKQTILTAKFFFSIVKRTMNMKFLNLISFFFILIFGLFDTINAMVIPSDCAVVEEVINTIGNDLQKTYNNLSIINCCDFPQITCQNLDNEIVVTEM